jgi:hypothetical protein
MAEFRPQMEITENAEQQLEEKYSLQIARPAIKEAVRKWNAKERPRTLAERFLFEVFTELQRKVLG